MKKIKVLTVIALSLFTLSSMYASGIEGVWVSDRQQKKIVIKQYDRELFVRGVYPNYDKGQVFRRSTKTRYRDSYGNLIKITRDGIIQVRYVHTTSRMDFRKVSDIVPKVKQHQPQRSNRSSSRNRSTYNQSNRSAYDDRGIIALEGTWFNRDINQEVYIIADRYGIKAAIKRGEWTYFEQINENTYKDNRGNTYTVNRDGSMSWVSNDRTRVFDLVKQSSTIPY